MRLVFLSCITVILVAFLITIFEVMQGDLQTPVTFQRFSEMLKHHDVKCVALYKSGDLLVAEVFLKSSSTDKPEYHDAVGHNPGYKFTAATYDGLVKGINSVEDAAHFTDAERIPVSIEAGHASVLSNWLVQCIIMLILLLVPVICGYFGFKDGKNRTIGATPGLLLGIFMGPLGLIIVYLTEKIPSQKNGGIRV